MGERGHTGETAVGAKRYCLHHWTWPFTAKTGKFAGRYIKRCVSCGDVEVVVIGRHSQP